nr:ferredoxin C 1, chloroplastic [Tanacetum cinerariifolium]
MSISTTITTITPPRFNLTSSPSPQLTPPNHLNFRHHRRHTTTPKSYKVSIEHDGVTTNLEVDSSETILDKALESGLDVPHDCKLGVCMTCPAKLLAGEVDQSEGMLSDDVIERGYSLLCVSYPKSDCVVKIIPEEELLSLQLATADDELRNELKYVRNGVKMNEISCIKVGHLKYKSKKVRHPTSPKKGNGDVFILKSWMTIDTNVTAPVNVTGASVTKQLLIMLKNPINLMGQNFKRWQQKMFFYLTTLNLARFLNEIAPQVEPPNEGMTLSETYQVAATIEKLPPSWVEFKNYLKRKRKDMSVEDLVVCLRIEEDNKLAQKNTYTPDSAKANIVEHAESSSKSNSKEKGKGKGKNDKKGKGKVAYLGPKAGIVKQKFQGTCYNYDQPGHRATNFKIPKRVNPRQANMVNDNMDMTVIAVDNGEKLYMGNSATVDIKGEGDVILKMTSEKELKLTNVFKDEAIEKFVLYKTEVENQLGRKIKVVRSDRRGEYVSSFTEVCAKHGIRHEFIAPYSPQQNGIAERKNRTVKEMVNAMLISSSLCQDMLGEAILTTTYLLNKIPRKDKEETSYELWMGRKPSYDNEKMIKSTKDMLKLNFDMKDIGLADVILRIKIIRTQNELMLSQEHYVDKILNTHNAGDSGLDRTPIDTNLHLSKIKDADVAQLEHSRVIGMVLHYLRYSHDYGLHYNRYPVVLEGYSDAHWISDIKDSRSTSGYMFTVGGTIISWKSSKQTVIAKSTIESEFIALDKCEEEAEWLRQFVEDIPMRTWWCEGGCGEEVVEAAVGCDDVCGGGCDDGGGWRWGSLGGDGDECGEGDVGGGWCCWIGGGLVLEGRLVVSGRWPKNGGGGAGDESVCVVDMLK